MFYLLASILSSAMIYVVFKLAKPYKCSLTPLILVNYFAATILGLLLFNPLQSNIWDTSANWIPFGILLGILFILLFYLIGNSSQKAGIAVTTLANKLSLVFPVLFSLFYFNETPTTIKTIGLLSSFVSVFLTVYKKDLRSTNIIFIILPLIIFIGSGITDSVIKFVQAVKINPDEASIFSALVFFIAFLLAIAMLLIRGEAKKIIHPPTLILGTTLGLVNFGSLYFIINALNKSNIDSSMVFTINNMSIVALSALLGTFLFHEKLSRINLTGIFLAILSLYFLL